MAGGMFKQGTGGKTAKGITPKPSTKKVGASKPVAARRMSPRGR